MIRLKYPVIVEGKYDKIRLASLISSPVFTTDGFGIFRDGEKRNLIRRLCEQGPIVILTDSDKGGALIRRAIQGIAPAGRLINVYIPRIRGKEKRKSAPSKEGTLGVEGMDERTLTEIFLRSQLTVEHADAPPPFLDRARFYADGLMGGANSGERRKRLARILDVPAELSTTAFIEAINLLCREEEYRKALEEIGT